MQLINRFYTVRFTNLRDRTRSASHHSLCYNGSHAYMFFFSPFSRHHEKDAVGLPEMTGHVAARGSS